MKLILSILACLMYLNGCFSQQARWTNQNYADDQLQDTWNVDLGRCGQEARFAYPDLPPPVIDPYNRNSRYATAAISDRRVVSGYRNQFVHSCMAMRGWQSHVVPK